MESIPAVNALRLLPVILAFLLLAAHFLRGGHVLPVAVCVALPALLLLRERWVPRCFQLLLLIGSLEWLRTLHVFASLRIAAGQPWGRLAAILGTVAVLTALSGLVFRSRALRRRYGTDRERPDEGTSP